MKKKKRGRQKANKLPKGLAGSNDVQLSAKGMIIALIACMPLLILGLALIFAGLNLGNKACTAETKGIVTEHSRTYASGGKTYYRNTYTYKVDGKNLTGEFINSDIGVSPNMIVTVCYDPNDPENSYVKKYQDQNVHVGIILVGVLWISIYLVLTYFVLILRRNDRARQNQK